MVLPVALHDVRDLKPYGDQTSHVYLGLSLAYDSHTFNFDRRDALRWHNAGWVSEPFTLFFQRYDGGWAASKPYGYPAFLAPFIAALGMASGVAIGNALLLLALIGGSLWLALRRFDPLTASLAVGAFYFGGYIYMYAYPANVELFEAATTLAAFGGAYAFRSSGRVGWALFAVVAMAFGVIEKLPLFFLYAPLAAVMLWELRERRKQMLLVFATGLIAVGVAATPYLKYSDGDSFTPYAGERYQLVPNAGSRPPWAGGALNADYIPSGADEGAIAKRATTGKLLDRFESLGYYVAGRYTGLLRHRAAGAVSAGGAPHPPAGFKSLGGGGSRGRARVHRLLHRRVPEELLRRRPVAREPLLHPDRSGGVRHGALRAAGGAARQGPVGRRRRASRCCSAGPSTAHLRTPISR